MHQHEHRHFLGLIEDAPDAETFELPCRMGDVVWGLKIYRDKLIPKQGIVHQMYYGEDMRLCICVKGVCRGQWGKNVFGSEQEATEALRKRDADEKA